MSEASTRAVVDQRHRRWRTWGEKVSLVLAGSIVTAAISIYALLIQHDDFRAQLNSQVLVRQQEKAEAVFNDFSALTNRLSLARQHVWASKSDSALAEYLRAENDWEQNEPRTEALLATYFGALGQNYFEAKRSDLREFDNLLCLWTQYTGNDNENVTHNPMFFRSEWEEFSRARLADVDLQAKMASMIRDGKVGVLASQVGAIGPPTPDTLQPIPCGGVRMDQNAPYLAPQRLSRQKVRTRSNGPSTESVRVASPISALSPG